MDLKQAQKSPPTSDEDEDCSEGDERSDGRRRRFCIERKQQSVPQQQSQSKRTRINTVDTIDNSKKDYDRASGRKRKVCDDYKRQKRIKPMAKNLLATQQQPPQPLIREPPKGPVIFINPKFIKKFIEKSIKLTSSSSSMMTNSTVSSQNSADGTGATTSSVTSMIDEIDFKTSPKEALQAASTMAIIRLVTECIEDDSKRDEKFNKTLVSRLIECLSQHGMPKIQNDRVDVGETVIQTQDNLHTYNSGISENDEEEEEEADGDSKSEGQPIPVIGGSVNHHFNKNINHNYYSPRNHNQQQYQRQPRRHSSDRNNVNHTEIQKNNKLRHYS